MVSVVAHSVCGVEKYANLQCSVCTLKVFSTEVHDLEHAFYLSS